MKIKLLITCVLVCILSSCQEIPEKIVQNINSIENLDKLTAEIIKYNASNFSKSLSIKEKNEFWLDRENVAINAFDHLHKNSVNLTGLDPVEMASIYDKIDLKNAGRNNRLDNKNYSNFNLAQTQLLNPFMEAMMKVNELTEVNKLTINFSMEVINSPLSQIEKDELLIFVSTAKSLANFLDNGGVDIIYEELLKNSDVENSQYLYRVQGCEVSTKEMFRSAVTGFFKGAVVGAYIGAAGGTVALPVVGSVSGAVSGAVFGAAYGFASHAVESVATQLLWSCIS